MTIHHFMTHTAGLSPLPSLTFALKKSFEVDPYIHRMIEKSPEQAEALKTHPGLDTYEELMESIAGREFTLLGEPGTQFSYSNDSYALLGTIIERVSGKTYEAYVKDHNLDQAGMSNTVFPLEELQDHSDTATLYASITERSEKEMFAARVPWDAPPMRAAGFLNSTVRDQLKYRGRKRVRSHQGQSVVPPIFPERARQSLC